MVGKEMMLLLSSLGVVIVAPLLIGPGSVPRDRTSPHPLSVPGVEGEVTLPWTVRLTCELSVGIDVHVRTCTCIMT